MRRAAKVDANQPAVVAALRGIGAKVVDLSAVGQGVPDLLVGHRGRWGLLEVKDGAKPESARKLTEAQQRFHKEHAGLPIFIVTSEKAAIGAAESFDLWGA